jgi:2-methylcitrate dehydratase PrpD
VRGDVTTLFVESAVARGAGPLAPSTREAVARAFLDWFACATHGATAPELAPITKLAMRLGPGGAPALGSGQSFNPLASALLDGAQAHAFELDDTHSLSSVHPGGPVIAAAIAAFYVDGSPASRLDGNGLAGAMVIGYEVACRTGMAARGSDPYARGFHPTGVYGTLGAAAAATFALGGGVPEVRSAIGIAASQAAGSMAYLQNGAWTKRLHPGWASMAGVAAAMLALDGLRAPDRIVDGMYDVLSSHSSDVARRILVTDADAPPEIERTSFKLFPCCRTIHPAITAILEGLRTAPRPLECVSAIHLVISAEDLKLVAEPARKKRSPQTPTEAQFSLNWGAAAAAVRGRAGLAEFSREALDDPELRRVAELVTYEVDDAFTRRRPLHFPCRARVTDATGLVLEAEVDAPYGDLMNPLNSEQLRGKALDLLTPLLEASRTARAADRAAAMLGCPNVPEAFAALARETALEVGKEV